MVAVFVILGILAIIGVVLGLVYLYEKKRTESLTTVAADLGLDFSPTENDGLLEKMQIFSLFNKGHSRKIKNIMKAETEATNLMIFDYQYTTGHGKNQHTHQQTVVAMESNSLGLPKFSMRPEGFFSKIGAALGMQDIDFDDHPEFSKSFVLKGENEAAIRKFFDAKLLDFLAARKKSYIESAPGVFIFVHRGRKKPEQIKELMNDGYAVYAAFAERLSRSLGAQKEG